MAAVAAYMTNRGAPLLVETPLPGFMGERIH
jgi:hypothetical protein